MKNITLLQVNLSRIILVYVIQGVVVIYFSIMAFQVIKRKRQRLNLIFGGFFLSVCCGNILNMIYAAIPLHFEMIIEILHFLTLFFIFFAIIFILIVNLIILESTLIYSVKRQNRYILFYGLFLFFGMLIFVLIQDIFGLYIGLDIEPSGFPKWSPAFFIFVISITSIFAIIPIIYTNWKIYNSFETKKLKKKWFCHFIGSLGVFSIGYLICIANLIGDGIRNFRNIVSILGISIVIWVSLMYYGIGFKLKK